MKKLFTLSLSLTILFLSSCKNELCYDCKKDAGNQARFCLPRQDAKEQRDQLERQGYSCEKFSQ